MCGDLIARIMYNSLAKRIEKQEYVDNCFRPFCEEFCKNDEGKVASDAPSCDCRAMLLPQTAAGSRHGSHRSESSWLANKHLDR